MNTDHTNRNSRRENRKSQSGTTLIEVLITLVVLAFGLLGIGALQLISKRSNFEALQRTTATAIANDIIERMRANSNALLTYAGDPSTPSFDITGALWSSEPVPNCTAASPCLPNAVGSTADLADHDIWEIEQALIGAAEQADGNDSGGLTQPTACIRTTVAAGLTNRTGQYIITIAWRGQAKLSDPDTTNTCGQTSGRYNSDGSTSDNAHRRLLVVNHFLRQN